MDEQRLKRNFVAVLFHGEGRKKDILRGVPYNLPSVKRQGVVLCESVPVSKALVFMGTYQYEAMG